MRTRVLPQRILRMKDLGDASFGLSIQIQCVMTH